MTLQLGPTTFEPQGGAYGYGRIASGLPFVGDVSSPYGAREITDALRAAGVTNPFHGAIDIGPDGGRAGVPFGCPSGGPVVSAENWLGNGGKGFWIEVECGDFRWGTYHLAEPASDYATGLDLQPGDYVYRGQIVGVVGTTGASTGIHSHFYVLERAVLGDGTVLWEPRNPADYFTAQPVAASFAHPAIDRFTMAAHLNDPARSPLYARDEATLPNTETYRVTVVRDEQTGAIVG